MSATSLYAKAGRNGPPVNPSLKDVVGHGGPQIRSVLNPVDAVKMEGKIKG
jgi:hypothetical protein